MIPVHEIKDTLRIEYDHIDAGDLELKDPLLEKVDSIKAQVDIRAAAVGIIADFRVGFRATFMCVRCLELFVTTRQSGLLLNYVPGPDQYAAENIDLTRTEIDRIHFTGPHIDLKIGIREAILLSLPIAPLCKNDCAGLCEKCGANKNRTQCTCVIEKPGAFTPVTIPDRDKKTLKKKGEARRVP